MSIRTFKLWNRSFGWGVFSVALITFSSTVEPTASFWDAGEYISTAAKLQVGHPPGAPLFQMIGAFFALFSTSPENIALMVNYMSVFSSAFSVLFLFWTLTLLMKKLPVFKSLKNTLERFTFFGSASVGALAFCFSDSFWFNAVEAEVYAMATFILSLLFWLGLRWEQEMNTPRGDRWLLLISFIIGLSFGVHFMGLLTIPAIGMIYYFRNTPKITLKGFLLANLISIAILLFIFKLLLPTTLAFFGNSEVFFVNVMGLPFNSGTVIAGFCILLFFYFSLGYTQRQKWVNINTIILSVLFVLVGFSSWLMIPIRANANTVINENSPADARSLLAYYNLEQYPETHLFYGPLFSDIYAGQDKTEPYVDDKPKYERDYKTGKYIIVNHWKRAKINSNSKHRGLLPRMWSSEHAGNYMNFTGPLEFSILPEYQNNEVLNIRVNEFREDIRDGVVTGDDYHKFFRSLSPYLEIKKPSFWSSFQFLFQYQISYMYWRYFMWNFTGRQNDIAGTYNVLNGNWISGIPLVDNLRLGNQSEISDDAKNNKSRNTYFFLPFLLGLIGLIFVYNQDPKRFWVLLLFFLFTGLALKIYLNERPFEPRERDYALVGSFYVFTLWIGMGTFYLSQKVKSLIKSKVVSPLVVVICFMAVPLLMAYQNWDDHDRSNRYTAQSMAKSYLESIQKDVGAIIFTIGDNDTFALWYAQEIEGYRTDVKTINTSLLATDWYIDQLKRKTYESDPIPSQMSHPRYAYGIRDYIKHESLLDSVRWDIKDFMNWVASDHPRTKYKILLQQTGQEISRYPKGTQEMVFYPTNKIRVKVNKENVLKSGLVKPENENLIVPFIDIDLPKGGMTKNQIMMLDILANNDWERPIYFTGGSYADAEYIWMKDYLQLEGLVYKLVPIKTPQNTENPYIMGRIDADLMYDIVMNWSWGNSESPNIYHDTETRKNSISFRSNMARLAEKLIDENKKEKAKNIIDLAMEKMPLDYFGYYSLLVPFVDIYYSLETFSSARNLFRKVSFKYRDQLEYFASLTPREQFMMGEEIITEIERYRTLVEVILIHRDRELLNLELDLFTNSIAPFINLYGDYDYYTSLPDFVEGYYLSGQSEKAEKLVKSIIIQYEDRFNRIAQLSKTNKKLFFDRIKGEILDFQELIYVVELMGGVELADSLQKRFDKSMEQFELDNDSLVN